MGTSARAAPPTQRGAVAAGRKERCRAAGRDAIVGPGLTGVTHRTPDRPLGVTELLKPEADGALAEASDGVARGVLSGTLAASMERLARMAAGSIGAPAVLLALLGDDRRCFFAGTLWREWFAHDTGALVRSGVVRRAVDLGGTLAIRDARLVPDDLRLQAAAAELNLVALATVVLAQEDGKVLGFACALDEEPRDWTPRELALLSEFAEAAATELQLRALLAERDLRERRRREDVVHDALTGLPNRALFMQRLVSATQRARRGEDGTFAVLLVDLDGFRALNETLGHGAGDELLDLVARRLEESVRGGDMVARFGGDEFAILLERVEDARDSAVVAERVQRNLSAPFVLHEQEQSVSASIGIALRGPSNDPPEYVLRCADVAMYRAKNAGRGRYEIFDRAMHAEALTRLQIESDLRHALDRAEMLLQFQPIVSLADGRIAGFEALMRWHHRERGMISPAIFVPVAEDTGLIVPLGRWVLREACRQARLWQERLPEARRFSVSVNLSVREFGQPDLVRTVADILEETGLEPYRLHLEITESAVINQRHPVIETMEQLRALGVGIHLDDFGTGYSALSYLHRLPLDAVKVDRAFTSMIDSESRPMHVVQAIVSLAHAIGVQVVAEGVSTPEQLELLRRMGCEMAQGFLFARPAGADETEALLATDPKW